MTPEDIEKKVIAFMHQEFATFNSGWCVAWSNWYRHSPNLSCSTLKVYNEHGGKPFLSDVNHPNYLAGRNAVKAVFGVEPDLTREVLRCLQI